MNNIKSEAHGKILFGIDIGGTTVKCGTFSEDGRLLLKEEIPTRKDEGGSLILSDIKAYIDNILESEEITLEDVAGIGLGVPGAVTGDGTVNKCINIGWGVFNVEKTFSEMMGGITVRVGNDANMAALGEYWMGGAKEYNSLVFVTIGTGVGGGVIVDGKPLCGINGAAAEIGHLPIVEDETEYCNCGKKGCLEQVASASGIVRVANRFLQNSDEPSSLREAPYMSARVVFDEAKSGDGIAIKVTEYVCRYLGKGLACAAGMVDPECFVIGGGVSNAGEYLINLIEKYYKEYVFHPSKDTRIVQATLGNDAGMYGAARLLL
ncbi:MAG: ROK family glucokinase [Lachnospira sp.]